MRIFGFDIVRCSKADQREAEVLEKVVVDIYNNLVTFLAWLKDLTDEHDNEDEMIRLMYEFTETISKLMMVYNDNEFSVPLTSIGMMNRMNGLKTNIGNVQKIIMVHFQAKKTFAELEGLYEDGKVSETKYNDMMNKYESSDAGYEDSLIHSIKLLYAEVNTLIPIIQYDLIRILYGVDLVRANHRYQKQYRRNQKWKSVYEIKVMNECESRR